MPKQLTFNWNIAIPSMESSSSSTSSSIFILGKRGKVVGVVAKHEAGRNRNAAERLNGHKAAVRRGHTHTHREPGGSLRHLNADFFKDLVDSAIFHLINVKPYVLCRDRGPEGRSGEGMGV